MPARLPYVLLSACAAFALGIGPTAAASAPETSGVRKVLVLNEVGAGSASTAQQYIDGVMAEVARVNAWPQVIGTYHTQRAKAETFIQTEQPSFGILSLGAFLAMHKSLKLEVLGTAKARGSEGHYYIVSKTAATLDDCKGKVLATNHAEDAKFIDNVVSADDFDLADFQRVDKTKRPLQTVKAVVRGEAACALIDDGQMADLPNVEGGADLKPLWFSRELPALVVVSFPSAAAADGKSFAKNIGRICEGQGKAACDKAGILELKSATAATLKPLAQAYAKPQGKG